MRRISFLSTVVITMALLVSACGSEDSGAAGSEESDDPNGTAGSDAAGSTDAAQIEMIDVATGRTQSLEEALAPSDGKPVLAWFWAPFCPTCRGEAPELDEFMATNSDRVKMVGVGSRDDLEHAQDFLADTGVTNFPLLWEESGRSWVENAVAAQPYMILIDGDGEEVERWPGGASVVQIDNALAELG